jgi:class 3 adenylate cyclase
MKLPKLPHIGSPFPPFGELLHTYRTMRGVSVEDLGRIADLAPSAIRAMEQGARVAPPKATVKLIADALRLYGEERETLLDSAEMDSPLLNSLMGRKPALAPTTPLTASILVFLIADVRGYTHFTQEHGDDAAARLTTTFAGLAQAAVEQWDGRLVEIRGDEALAVFGSARQALRAALEIQTRCAAVSLAQPDMPLEVGIGLDVGEATPVEAGYRGAALNRAARLCSLARAGEVLLSTGVAYVAPMVEGVTFSMHGVEQLKGFAEPVPVLRAAPTPPALPAPASVEQASAQADAPANPQLDAPANAQANEQHQ